MLTHPFAHPNPLCQVDILRCGRIVECRALGNSTRIQPFFANSIQPLNDAAASWNVRMPNGRAGGLWLILLLLRR